MSLRNRWWNVLPLTLVKSVGELFGNSKEKRRKVRERSRRPQLEQLEDRTLMSITPDGVPDWVEQGPGPILNASSTIPLQNSPVAGAIEAIAVNPANSDVVYVGTVNGGIWKTEHANSAT